MLLYSFNTNSFVQLIICCIFYKYVTYVKLQHILLVLPKNIIKIYSCINSTKALGKFINISIWILAIENLNT